MLNEVGEALTSIAPESAGSVLAHGEVWRAIAREPIARGDRVRITSIEGLTLAVRKE